MTASGEQLAEYARTNPHDFLYFLGHGDKLACEFKNKKNGGSSPYFPGLQNSAISSGETPTVRAK